MYLLPSSVGTRAGFVARRDVGGAVVRSRSRRVMREAWRHASPSVTKPIEVVFLARPGIAQSRTPEVANEMRELLARQGVITG
jgi:ribonuclease P protein component